MKTKYILGQLKDIRKIATMEDMVLTKPGHSPFDKASARFNKEVKEAARIWRDSWILGPLDELIEMLEKELKK